MQAARVLQSGMSVAEERLRSVGECCMGGYYIVTFRIFDKPVVDFAAMHPNCTSQPRIIGSGMNI